MQMKRSHPDNIELNSLEPASYKTREHASILHSASFFDRNDFILTKERNFNYNASPYMRYSTHHYQLHLAFQQA